MNFVIGLIGLVIGLFLWSNIFGSLFATLPLQIKLKKRGSIKKINWATVALPVIFAGVVLVLTLLFLRPFFYGSLVSGIIMIFNVGKLKKEALENRK